MVYAEMRRCDLGDRNGYGRGCSVVVSTHNSGVSLQSLSVNHPTVGIGGGEEGGECSGRRAHAVAELIRTNDSPSS